MNTENRDDKLVDFARRYGIRGVTRYESRKNSWLMRAVAVIFGGLYLLTIGSLVHLARGAQVVRRPAGVR